MITEIIKKVIHKVGDAIKRTEDHKASMSNVEMSLKWDKGKIGKMIFTDLVDGNWTFTEPTVEEMNKIVGGYVKGLLADMFDMQICIALDKIPRALDVTNPLFWNTLRTEGSVAWMFNSKDKLAHQVLNPICKELNIYVLPVLKGKPINFNGKMYLRLVAMNRKGTFEETFSKRFEEVFGYPIHENCMKELPKLLTYLASNISKDGTFTRKIMVFPNEAFKEKFVHDGAAYYFPGTKEEQEKVWMELKYRDMTHKVKFDGRILHVRGIGNRDGKALVFKGTLQPITPSDLKEELTDAYRNEVMKAFNAGYIVGTKETLKWAPAGEYETKFWIHDDTRMHKFFGKGKLFFEQLYRKMRITNLGRIPELVRMSVLEMATAMSDMYILGKTLGKNRDAYNDSSLPVKEFHGMFDMVLQGLPPMLHSSMERAVRLSLPSLLKYMSEIHIGTSNYDNFDWDSHNGIYFIDKLAARSRLKDNEIEIGRRRYHYFEKLLKKTGKTWDDIMHTMIRCPVMVTSMQKVKIVCANDDFDGIRLGKKNMMDLGGDIDGDSGMCSTTPKDLFDFEPLTAKDIVDIETKLNPAQLKAVNAIESLVSRFRPVASMPFKSIEDAIPSMIYELDQANSIGIVDNGNLKVLLAMALRKKQSGWTPEMVKDLMFRLEVGRVDSSGLVISSGILQAIIDGKKALADRVPDVAAIMNQLVMAKANKMPDAFSILRGNCVLTNMIDIITEEETFRDYEIPLIKLPAVMKDWANKSLRGIEGDPAYNLDRMQKYFPVHTIYFQEIVKHFPNEMRNSRFKYELYRKNGPVRMKVETIANAIFGMFPHAKMKDSITTGGKGFTYSHWETANGEFFDDKLSHEFIEEYAALRNSILSNKDMPSEEKNLLINREKRPTFDRMIALAKSPTGRAAVEMLIACIATINVFRSGSSLSFLFNYLHPATITTFFAFLRREDPDKYFKTKDDDDDKTTKITATGRPDAKVYGNIGALPANLKKELMNKFTITGRVESLENPADYIIAVDDIGDNRMYEALKNAGINSVELFKRRKSGEWYHYHMGETPVVEESKPEPKPEPKAEESLNEQTIDDVFDIEANLSDDDYYEDEIV